MSGKELLAQAGIDWVKVDTVSNYENVDTNDDAYLDYLRREGAEILDQLLAGGWTVSPPQWSTWQGVPGGVTYRGSAGHIKAVYVNRAGVRHAIVDGAEYPSTVASEKVQRLAPFVPAGAGEEA